MPVLDLSQRPASLRMEGARLMIESRDGSAPLAVALIDLDAVILSNPQIHLSQAVLGQLATASVPLVVCDAKHQPTGMLVPLVGNAIQTERIRVQAVVSEPRRKQLWKQVVQAKLRNQAGLLERRSGVDHGLRSMAQQVQSGDSTNREAQGARRYWTALFGPEFRRDRDAMDANRFLNYGYALLRSLAARALVGAGLHPSLGLQHHNRYDPMALASDLMEPFRPWVDARVLLALETGGDDLTPATKTVLFGLFQDQVGLGEERWPLPEAMHRSAARLTQAYAQGRTRLLLPAW